MKIKLYSKPQIDIPPKIQVALNRGIPPQDIPTYLSNSYNEILPAEAFGEDLLKQAAKLLANTISANKRAFIIVD